MHLHHFNRFRAGVPWKKKKKEQIDSVFADVNLNFEN